MSKWRKKPVVIDAFEWTGGPDQTEDPEWICAAIRDGRVWFEHKGSPHCCMMIKTREGIHRADMGDWIIRGVKGELYSCKPDIFEMTYEDALAGGSGERESCCTCPAWRSLEGNHLPECPMRGK